MSYRVLLTRSAERDLEEIYDYIAETDTQGNADHVLDKLMGVAETLATFPERGSYPKELLLLGIREYRQAHFKPYRLIYRVIGKQVLIYMIADGRRDMQTLLSRRMLGV
ncbi:MAG: type II toxin-antitoxin system RelE/ParE family toxin [Nitrosomonadales bacterium]|nr:type II toxin-antitoxin system RelE/ParE family toxin [Nitrosomonadales bacterium]